MGWAKFFPLLSAFVLAASSVGCTGVIRDPTPEAGDDDGQTPSEGAPDEPPGSGSPPDGDSPPTASACATATLPVDQPRRLNIGELNAIVADVLGDGAAPFSSIGNDYGERVGTFLGTTERFLAEYFDVAESVAERYVADQNLAAQCGDGSAACAGEVLKPIAERLLRRPLSADQVAALGAFIPSATGLGLTVADGLTAGLASVLMSPDFFVVGTDAEAAPGDYPLDGYARAERLALAIWSSVPDDALLAAAADGSLMTAAGMEAQVRRMLADPDKGRRFLRGFVESHFDLPSASAVPLGLEALGSDAELLAGDLRREAELIIEHAFEQNLSLERLVQGTTTFLNQRLAEHYGIPGVTGETFVEVSTEGTPRVGGLLTSGAILAQEGDLIHRGVNVLQSYLCQTFAPPDPEVVEAALAELPDNATVREQVQFRTRDGCAGCHASIDPLGAAFEIFDEAGRLRGAYPNGDSVQYSSVYAGQPINGPADVTKMVVQGAFRTCLTNHMLGWVSFRRMSIYRNDDRCAIDSVLADAGSEAGFRDVVVNSFLSETFTHRVVE